MKLLLAGVTAANCYNLPPVQRAYCRAIAHREVAHCYSIQDSNLRMQCRALLYQEASVCDGLTEDAGRHFCRSKVDNQAR